MTSWCSLYLPCANDDANNIAEGIVEPLKAALLALGYEFYNPFGLIPGKAYGQTVRLFAAPPRGGWLRIIGVPDAALLPALMAALTERAPCLLLELDGTDAHIEAYVSGAQIAPEAAFPADADCIRRALAATASASAEALGGVTLDSLPGDVQAMAQQIDLKQAGKLFNRMSAGLAQKSGGDPAASDLLKQPDWSGAGGAKISALIDCLRIPGGRAPDFVTLRDAYSLHERRRRSPKAMLYPGDAETMASVPDVLDYTPIYAGKD